jgi:plastocyanin
VPSPPLPGPAPRALGAVAAVTGLVAALAGCAPAGRGDALVVEARDSRFEPSVVRVPVGGTVLWVNRDLYAHNVAAASFASPRLDWQASWRYTFRAAGHYEYRCDPHPTMRGMVIVGETMP